MFPRFYHLIVAALLCLVVDDVRAASLVPTALQCEGRFNPMGIDVVAPQLGWKLRAHNDSARGLRQTAWQIMVATNRDELDANRGSLWDSGKVISDETMGIACLGKKLSASQRVFWKVRVWDQADQPSDWSAPAEWTMGLLTTADWRQASWIALADTNVQSQLLRREFAVKAGLKRAVLHVSGLGHYELFLNGKKVGEDILTPGWTDYRKTVCYDTHDVTAMLATGANAMGIILGNGMYSVQRTRERYNKFAGSIGPPKTILLLRLEYADGNVETVVTDEKWQARFGPITYSNVYGGEDYDARLHPAGWDYAGFVAANWSPVIQTSGPGGELRGLSAAGWPLRVIETLKPVASTQIKPGITVYDFGQNAPLMPSLVVTGVVGSTVKMVPSELVKESGEIDDTVCKGKTFWTYTLAGGTNEIWFPKFFYRGARYLQVELQPVEPSGDLPQVVNLEGAVVHAAASATGNFTTSSELFNRIHTLVRWGQRGNMASILTDCPHREKLGWLEQDYLNGPALRYNFNLDPLFAKIVSDIRDAQLTSGLVPNIAPEYTVFGWWDDMQFRESPEWGSAFIQIPWQQYLFTGDFELARRHYDRMKRYLDYLGTQVGADGILSVKGSLGDWYDIGPKGPGRAQLTPADLTATAIYHDDLMIMKTFAMKLNRSDDAQLFQKRAEQTQAAFDRAYLNPAQIIYATGSQTANAMPLALGMVAPESRSKVLATIVADVQAKGLTAGDVGYRYLLRALADGGRSDVIFAMNHQSEKPGYGYQLKMGATSLTEAWDARRASSQNHFMLGQINEWFFHDLAGIQPDPESPGFKTVVIKPAIGEGLDWVKASYDSVRGQIGSEWRRDDKALKLLVDIPPNTAATVYVPCRTATSVLEGNQSVKDNPDCRYLRYENGCAIYQINSGRYAFTTTR